MKNIKIFQFIYFFLGIMSVSAQAPEQDFDVAVMIPRYTLSKLPGNSPVLLADRLRQALAVNGRVAFMGGNGSSNNADIGGSESDYCFVLIPVINELARNITSNPPVLHTVELNVTLYIAGYDISSTFATHTFTVKGAGTTYEKSYLDAIKRLDPKNAQLQEYIISSKAKIRKYYSENCDYLMNEAESIAQRTSINDEGYNSFMKAINILTQISKVNPKCYSQASSKVQDIYERYRKFACSYFLTMAKIQWVARKSGEKDRVVENEGNSKVENRNVFFYLRKIPPSTYCERELNEFLKEIENNNIKYEDRDFNLAKYRDSTSANIEKHRLDNQSRIIDASILSNIGLSNRRESASTAVNILMGDDKKTPIKKD
jgi:hypothetical protein